MRNVTSPLSDPKCPGCKRHLPARLIKFAGKCGVCANRKSFLSRIAQRLYNETVQHYSLTNQDIPTHPLKT